MIEKIISWSIRNRIIVLLITLVITIISLYAISRTTIDAIPDLSDVQVIVKTSYPGQAPQVVEDQVTYPLASALLSVPEAQTVRAFSFFGDSYVYVIFKDGTDPYWARTRVLEYLDRASSQLPEGVKPELGPDATGVGWIYEYALVDSSGNYDLAQLTSLQNWFLKFELQTVPGVAEVATVGGMVKQYQITLLPNRMRAYDIKLSSVKKAIKDANQEVGGSVIEMSEAEYMIRTNGYLNSIASIKNIPLGINKNGVPILLKNVANIKIGPQARRGIAELNGQGEVVGGIIVMRQGGNALETIKQVKTKLSQLESGLPKGVQVVTVYDRSNLIMRAVETLKSKLIEEIIVVVLVCFLFLLHFRSSLVVAISLPIGVLCAFIVMYFQGINANIMSLSGIAIAIGAMVDGAIVMIENYHKHCEGKKVTSSNRWDLVKKSSVEVGRPLFFSLLIITLSFLPVFALQAQEGRMFSPMAYTKTYAMAAAAGLAITLIPVLIGYLVRGKLILEYKNPVNKLLVLTYKPALNLILNYPKVGICCAILLIIATVFPYSKLGSEFMPELNEGDWMYMPTTLPGISIGKARELLQQTDKLIMSVPEVESVFGKIGRANTATDPAPLTMIESIIRFKPHSQWRQGMTKEKLKQELNMAVNIPGVNNAWVMPIKTRIDMLATGIKTPIGIKISGPSLDEIQYFGQQIEKILRKVPGTLSVYADRTSGGRYINIDINRQSAARFNLSVADIQEVVSMAIGGMTVSESVEGRERYPINLRYPHSDRNTVQKIKMLPIVAKSGAHIPLSDVANVYIADGPPILKSEDARLVGWILVDVQNTDIGKYISTAQESLRKDLKLPVGYHLTWSGQYEYMERAKERLAIVAPITILIISILLFVCFRRLMEVLLILLTLPLAFVGGIWLLYLLNYNLSVAVGVGFLALAGVAVEIGVIMLIYLNIAVEQARQTKEEKTLDGLRQAIMQGALRRVRPVVMTVATIIASLMTIMLTSGTGSEVMRRIAAPMLGGTISAMILTLLLIPAIYYICNKKNWGDNV